MLLRRKASQILEKKLSENPAVAILGPRQVGKTTLAKEFMTNKEAVYLDLELPSDLARLADAESFLIARKDKLIVIDEVQRMPELFPVLRSIIDSDRKNGKFLLLGSASPNLLARSSETLAGRISFLELHPLHLTETHDLDSYRKLWLRGGFPAFYLANNDEQSLERRMDFLSTYVERELPLLGLDLAPRIVRNAIQMLTQLNGNLLNVSTLSKSLGLDQRKVKEMLDYFENAFLTRSLQPFFINISKRLVKSPKVFFRDTGLLHAAAGVETSEELDGFLQRGASFEAFIIQQIIGVLKPTITPYFYRTHDGTELDLVLVKGTKPVLGIEIKTSNAPKITRGTTIASEDLGGIPVLIVTPSVETPYPRGMNQSVIGLHDLVESLEKHGVN
ncbi:MAG: ATP-binding protein [Cytophagales bacterium]|nr:ATP-binding protein [Cytophagales bacterium]